MKQDLQERLRRLGVTRGARNLKPPAASSFKGEFSQNDEEEQSEEDGNRNHLLLRMFPGGRLDNTIEGPCLVVDRAFPLDFQHGSQLLSDLNNKSTRVAAVFNRDNRLAELDFTDFLFLDTETTGLSGAGALAFMVGVAFFDRQEPSDALVVRQYFLRDHGDEKAMLLLLDELLSQKKGLITFNGRTFDIPFLDTRFLLNRMPSRLREMPHLDLLSPSRKIWRQRLGSVALSNLEKELLGVRRTEEDVPGWLIPGMYNDYLRSGDPRELRRIFYHNQIDMLSMITLTSEVIRQFGDSHRHDDPLDLFSLGRWQEDLGLIEAAEESLRWAAAGDMSLTHFQQIIRQLALLLKRNNRREEAVILWQQMAATSFDDVEAFEELAKYYEWHDSDLVTAIMWTERAIKLLDNCSPAISALQRPQMEHRLARLQRKLGQP